MECALSHTLDLRSRLSFRGWVDDCVGLRAPGGAGHRLDPVKGTDCMVTRGMVLCLVISGCSTGGVRDNPFDPAGTGAKAPGRLHGAVWIQGYPTQEGVQVHILDSEGSEVDAPDTDANGAFTSIEINAGIYDVIVDVPPQNSPVSRLDAEVLPGLTTEL